MKTALIKLRQISLSQNQVFMISMILVNGGNYLYNLLVGRLLGPEKFADAAILISMLMLLSFASMTFQLTMAKFKAMLDEKEFKSFQNAFVSISAICGIISGLGLIVFSAELQHFLNTSSKAMFQIFGLGVPLYFLMSVKRGYHQGDQDFKGMSWSYQAEMISKLLITLGLLYMVSANSANLISIGLFASFLFAFFPLKTLSGFRFKDFGIRFSLKKKVVVFLLLTASYEFSQIIINNGDIFLVKHFFASEAAGLYASLALVGRVVYFVTWMMVMMLLPEVINLVKNNEPTDGVLRRYLGYIGLLVGAIVFATALFPQFIIHMLFGEAYGSIAPLLWKYALATGLFALSNLFVYYYLSLSRYIPVLISVVFGMLQLYGIYSFNSSLEQVVDVQIAMMAGLLVLQLAHHYYQNTNSKKSFVEGKSSFV